MDPVTLTASAVTALSHLLAKAADGAAGKIGEEAGSKLLAWVREKLTGHGKQTLDDLAAAPDNEDNRADLRKQIGQALAANPALAAELGTLLEAVTKAGDTMVQNVTGAGAKGAQIWGGGNTITIG